MKAPNRSTVNNDDNSETGGERERKNNNNNNNRPYHTQAATLVANLIEHSHIQLYTGACLNDVFDCEFLMSYGSLLQIIRPAYEKGFWPNVFVLTEGTRRMRLSLDEGSYSNGVWICKALDRYSGTVTEGGYFVFVFFYLWCNSDDTPCIDDNMTGDVADCLIPQWWQHQGWCT